MAKQRVRKCRVCGCTDNDCRRCIERTGQPCSWVEENLCSACDDFVAPMLEPIRNQLLALVKKLLK